MAGAVPPQMVMQYPANDGMDALSRLHAVEVREKANLIQEITALFGDEIQMANKYNIMDTAGSRHFFAVERTDCCRRQMQTMWCHDCASWEVDISHTPPGFPANPFLELKRPCQLTCCCFNRPIASVIDKRTGVKIGSFRDPCTCCSLRFQIRDERDEDVLLVNGGCCQPGLWCPLPCGPCAEVSFPVQDVQSGATVAHVKKRVPSCLAWCCAPDLDNYHVTFDQVQHPQWKAILLAFTIFLDFRYFNVNKNEEDARGRSDNN